MYVPTQGAKFSLLLARLGQLIKLLQLSSRTFVKHQSKPQKKTLKRLSPPQFRSTINDILAWHNMAKPISKRVYAKLHPSLELFE